jgi:hypothetical protein
MGDQTAEWWGDWTPNKKSPNYGATSNTDGTDGIDNTNGALDDNQSGSGTKTHPGSK